MHDMHCILHRCIHLITNIRYVVKITGLITLAIFGLGRDIRLGQNCVRNLISFNLKG